MNDYIPYGRQLIEDDDVAAVVSVLRGDYLTTGPAIFQFEEALCHTTGAKYSVACSNGTAALHIACLAVGIGPGDEVITTPMTFAASANCILYVGATPVFADIDPITYNISPAEIRKKITPHTKAIIPVHFTGSPCEMDEIHEIAKEHGLIVIEDAAHALGATYKGTTIGSLSDMTTFSFHPVKHITTGEGGAVTTNDAELYQKLLRLRSHGITRNPEYMLQNDGPWYYEQAELGLNYRMTDIQAALGTSQLHKLSRFLARRKEIVVQYNEAFAGLANVIKPVHSLESAWHLYVIQVAQRAEIYEHLQSKCIGVNVHYIPVYWHPYYQKLGYRRGLCPVSEKLYLHALSLPLHPGMSENDVNRVIDSVRTIKLLSILYS